MNAPIFDRARFMGGPQICIAANLPAFCSRQEMDEFVTHNCPSVVIIAKWLCNSCGCLHFWSGGADPAGASSGTTRTSKHIEAVKAKFMKSPVAKTVKEWR